MDRQKFQTAAWRQAVVKAWSNGEALDERSLAGEIAYLHRVDDRRPDNLLAAAKQLAMAGFTADEIEQATGERFDLGKLEEIPMPLNVSEILAMHAEGYTPLEISRLTGMTRSAVYYHLTKRGIEPHRSSSPEITTRKRIAISKAHAKGESMASISRRFHVTIDQVRYALKEA